MKYEAVYLYNNRAEFIGAAIKKVDADLLQSVNIWHDTEEEFEDFRKTLASLNDEDTLRKFWPDATDPEVIELVDDPEWEPLELREDQVPDWSRSTVVMVKEPVWGWEFDSQIGPISENGVPEGAVVPAKNPTTGIVEWKDTDEIDHEASDIVYVTKRVPDPMEAQNRFFKAQEIVARRRSLATSA